MIILLKKSLEKRKGISLNLSPRLLHQPKTHINTSLCKFAIRKLFSKIDLNPREYLSATPEFKKSFLRPGGAMGKKSDIVRVIRDGKRPLIIPYELLGREEINPLEKLLLVLIDHLYSDEHKGCCASNEHLADILKVKPNTIAKSLVKLRKLNLIKDVSFDGRTRVIEEGSNE